MRATLAVAILASAGIRPAQADGPLTLRRLAMLDAATLDGLYAASPPGPVPVGRVRGRAIVAPGSPLAGPASDAARLYWQGKTFAPDGSTAINRFAGLPMIRGRVYLGPSWRDGAPALILDYKGTSHIYGRYRDEIRQVAPGLYLGLMYERTPTAPTFVRYFAFEDRP